MHHAISEDREPQRVASIHSHSFAYEHLHEAMRYTLMIPRSEVGMRRFCLWAIGMAVLTLWRIHRRPLYQSGEQVKIPRWMVKAVIVGSNLTVGHDGLLKVLFAAVTIGLSRHKKPIDPDVSHWGETSTMSYDMPMASGHDVRRVQ